MQEDMEGLPIQKHGKVSEQEKDFIHDTYNVMRSNVYNWRKELGLTRYEFAQKCKIGVASVAGIEEGKIIQFTRFLKICMHLGKTMQDLYDDTAYKEELLRNASRLQKEMERLGFNPDEKFEEIKQVHAQDKAALKIKRQETLAQLEMEDNEINRASK
tara:strand:- start:16 stop:489 length:474 start_codon:yes stop_codon:yes gene_type:complete